MNEKRIVIKVGSNILTKANGRLDITRMSSIVDQIAFLMEKGYEVILVTSGAVACGRGEFHSEMNLDSVEQRQLYSAMGQAKLIDQYYNLFREYGLHVGQILTIKENFQSEKSYQNQKACMKVMLENGIIPIVNENDTVCITELMFTDNDELSGLIASMMEAGTLVLLSNIDGVYTGAPDDPNSELISKVTADMNLDEYISAAKSRFGRGGMVSKSHTAQRAAKEGIRAIIANGTRRNILIDLISNPDNTPHTEFSVK